MKNKLSSLLLTVTLLSLILSSFPLTVSAAAPAVAKVTSATVTADGEQIAFTAYNIGGNNFFKLRDVAFVLNGSQKQFELGYDAATKTASIIPGKAYTPNNTEMGSKSSGAKQANESNTSFILDGKRVTFTAYNIDGNNYIKIRDIGAALDFFLGYDNVTRTITVDTSRGYVPEDTEPPSGATDRVLVGHWRYEGSAINSSDKYYYDYFFKEDGSFHFFYQSPMGGTPTETRGKYTVSNGKVYMTEVLYCYDDGTSEPYPDRVHEYEFGTTYDGKVCLKIGIIRLLDEDGTYVDMTWAVELRKF